MARFSVSYPFLFPNFATIVGKNKVPADRSVPSKVDSRKRDCCCAKSVISYLFQQTVNEVYKNK